MIIGLLALQGAVREHERSLAGLGAETRIVKEVESLDGLDGLVLPGGESTAIGLLAGKCFLSRLRELAQQGLPMFGTCAGMILLSRADGTTDEPRIGAIDIAVARNASGRQVDSFETMLEIEDIGSGFPAVFIRAPYVTDMGPDVRVMARHEGHAVMARQGSVLVASFHPELTDDLRVHEYYLRMVKTKGQE